MKPLTSLIALLASISLCFGNQISEDQKPFIKKYQKQKNIVPPESALINTDSEPALTEDFVSLYNGKDLTGWTPKGGNCKFEAIGKTIVGSCVKGSPSTYLLTDKKYADFIFTVEMKWEVDGNSGVMFRADTKSAKPDKKFETVFGPQVEMEGFESHDGKRKWSGGIYGQGYAAWIYPLWLDAHQDARAALKKDDWNRLTIHAVGDTVKTWVNGVPTAHWVDDQFLSGSLGLQVHSGAKGIIHFRNIKIKELSAATNWKDLFGTGDFSEWSKLNGDPVPINGGWSIKDGVIHRGGLKPGDIITRKPYQDFEMMFDWKISDGGNSGIKYRTRGKLGLEYQVLDDKKHKDGQIPPHRAASIYALVAAPDSKTINPPGEWNSGRIRAKGNLIQHWLNNGKVAEIEYGTADWKECFEKSKYSKRKGFGSWKGPVLLQDHSDEVWFRNIKIREL